ncbi:uncharacterized protein ACBT44_012279 isoform 1-T1 [Syngnathus typhle]
MCIWIYECPTDWWEHKSGCYRLNLAGSTWSNAETACMSVGGHLLSIWNKAELLWLKSLRLRLHYWTGLSRINNTDEWKWTDGSTYYKEDWREVEIPEKWKGPQCVALKFSTKKLTVMYCQEVMAFMCKLTLDTCICAPCYGPAPPAIPKSTTTYSPPTCPPCASTAPGHTTLPTILKTTAVPKTILAPEICKISINQSTSCASNDYTCSCLLGVFPNPDGAFQAELNDGLGVNRRIVIRGQADSKAERLIVKLLLGKEDNVTALQLNFHYGYKTIELNSRADNKTAQKTVNPSQHHKFEPGHNFKIVIRFGNNTFNMTLDDNVQLGLEHQFKDLQRIKWLEVWHVLLSSIQLM